MDNDQTNSSTLPDWPHVGAVLAGGDSSRMGTWKGDLLLSDGTSLAQRAIATLHLTCQRVVVVGRDLEGMASIPDERPGSGPLGGIESLLGSGLDSEYLVIGVDMPLVSSHLLGRLTAPSRADVTIFEVEGDPHVQSLPMRISAAVHGVVSSCLDQGRNAIHDFLNEVTVQRVWIDEEAANQLANVNDPGDYARIVKE